MLELLPGRAAEQRSIIEVKHRWFRAQDYSVPQTSHHPQLYGAQDLLVSAPQCPGFIPSRRPFIHSAQDLVTSAQDLLPTQPIKSDCLSATELGTRSRLLQLLAPTVRVTRLIPTADAVIVLTATDKDTDAVFQDDVLQKLSQDNYTAILPPELKAKRTVICSRLDDLVYQHHAEELREEVEIQEVFKFPRSNTVKFTFRSSEMARRAREEDLLLFSISLPPHQIKEETYTPLLTCNTCVMLLRTIQPGNVPDLKDSKCAQSARATSTPSEIAKQQ
ncbi:hypothetical protein O3P69_006472 [Scylla paramamosain]|uniref:Uncharacterized protein n=1 Tax=Scylla paramamosain TaxID=85552 RepID=A0AAW0U3E9_SCYPA